MTKNCGKETGHTKQQKDTRAYYQYIRFRLLVDTIKFRQNRKCLFVVFLGAASLRPHLSAVSMQLMMAHILDVHACRPRSLGELWAPSRNLVGTAFHSPLPGRRRRSRGKPDKTPIEKKKKSPLQMHPLLVLPRLLNQTQTYSIRSNQTRRETQNLTDYSENIQVS